MLAWDQSAVVRSAELESPSLWIGWQGHVILGSWTPVVHEVSVARLGDGGTFRLDVAATDPDGNLAVFTGDETTLDANHRRLTGRFQLGRPDGQIWVRVYRNGSLLWQADEPISSNRNSDDFYQSHTQAERLLITVGLLDKVQQMFEPPSPGKRTVVHYADSSALPTDDLAFDGVAGLLLSGKDLPNERQTAAISRWVQRGGRLYVSIGLKPVEFRETALAKSIPVTIDPEPVPTRELTALESYSGKTVRIIPAGTPLALPKLSYRFGKSLSRNDSVLIQVPHGFGAVTLLAMDVTQAPLREWVGLRDLLRKMTDTGEFAAASAGRTQQLGSTGITDLASQLSASMEHFEPVSRTSPWWVLGGLLIVIGLIGPLDYWLVGHVWRKPLATWISFPLFLSLSASAALWAAGSSNGHRWLINQLDVIDVDQETGFSRGRHFLTVYSPQSTAGTVEVRPHWTKWSPSGAKDARIALGWMGLPESSFGGMYRSNAGGLQFGQAEYVIHPSAGTMKNVPMAQWSTAPLSASSESSLTKVVDSNLSSSASGRLSGTVTHQLPGPLTNWFLCYAGRIYRLPAKEGAETVAPLAPGQGFRVDQPSVIQRELRGYLTRTTAHEIRGKDQSNSQLVVQQASYDPLARDLKGILPMLSFHGDAGGTGYTGLTNESLADQDLTTLLELDRAVLFGYLDRSAAEVALSEGSTPEVHRTTLVRLLLPVDRSKQAMRQMKRKFDVD